MPERDTWYADMAARYRQEQAEHEAAEIPAPVDPPDDGTCRDCYEWRYFPRIQRHFGQAWWLICDMKTCPHEHHKDEVWMA